MPPSRPLVQILVVTGIVLLVAPASRAQVTNVDSNINIAVAPSPGSGHDYVKMLSETVNPANGSLSLRIEGPVPKQRGYVNFPYYIFSYDSGGVSLPQSNVAWSFNGQFSSPSLQVSWTDSSILPGNGTLAGLVPGGFVANAGIGQTFSQTNSLSAQVNGSGATASCDYQYPYMFIDPSGARHTMNLLWITQQGGGGNPGCSYFGVGGPYIQDADSQYQANLLPNSYFSVISDAHGRINRETYPGTEDTNGNCCGFTAQTAITNNQITSITVPGQAAYTLTYGTQARNYAPAFIAVTGSSCTSLGTDNKTKAVVKTITLPNLQQYTFGYHPVYGLLNSITYPTGATVSYTWSINANSESLGLGAGSTYCQWQHDWPAIQKRVVSFDGVTPALEQDFSYTTQWGSGGQWTTKTTTVTTKDLLRSGSPSFQTIFVYSGISINGFQAAFFYGQTPIENSITYYDWNGSLLQTVTKNWNTLTKPPLLLSQCVTPANGSTAGTFYSYGPLGVMTDKKEYDYGTISSNACAQGASAPTATPTRETVTTYQSFPADSAIYPSGPYIYDRPSSVVVKDSTGTRAAETDYAYDQTSVLCAGSPNCVTAAAHDEANYGTNSTAPRGNVTTVTKQCFNGPCTSGNPASTYTYDVTGQVLFAKDPNTYITTYSYADNYASCAGAAPPSGPTNAYLSSIKDPLGHITTFCYGYDDGQLRGSTDANSQTTIYKYNSQPQGCGLLDKLGRISEVDYPDSGETTFCYNDSPFNASTPSPNVTTTKTINSSTNLVTLSAIDGMGHITETRLTSDPDGVTYTDTKYDGLGRPYQAYNPTRCNPATTNCGESTWGYTTSVFDGLGRVSQSQPKTAQSPHHPTPATAPQSPTRLGKRASLAVMHSVDSCKSSKTPLA